MSIRSRMNWIVGQIEPEHLEIFALEFGKLLIMTLFTLYHLQILTNQHQSAPIVVKLYVIIRSRMTKIMDLIGLALSKLSALELENLLYLICLKSSICKY